MISHSEIDMINSTTGWAVGNQGKIFNTTDGGTNWTYQTVLPSSIIYNFSFIDENTALGAKNNNQLLRTTDGGATSKVKIKVIKITSLGKPLPNKTMKVLKLKEACRTGRRQWARLGKHRFRSR